MVRTSGFDLLSRPKCVCTAPSPVPHLWVHLCHTVQRAQGACGSPCHRVPGSGRRGIRPRTHRAGRGRSSLGTRMVARPRCGAGTVTVPRGGLPRGHRGESFTLSTRRTCTAVPLALAHRLRDPTFEDAGTDVLVGVWATGLQAGPQSSATGVLAAKSSANGPASVERGLSRSTARHNRIIHHDSEVSASATGRGPDCERASAMLGSRCYGGSMRADGNEWRSKNHASRRRAATPGRAGQHNYMSARQAA